MDFKKFLTVTFLIKKILTECRGSHTSNQKEMIDSLAIVIVLKDLNSSAIYSAFTKIHPSLAECLTKFMSCPCRAPTRKNNLIQIRKNLQSL